MKKLISLTLLSFTLAMFSGCFIDSDGDGEPDMSDQCPLDSNKTKPGECGCGIEEGTCSNDNDSDNDGTPDQEDKCPLDPNKIQPGACGCGVLDKDSDGDNTPDCKDNCPNDANKVEEGECGCGVAEGTCSNNDADGDGTPDDQDGCPNDPNKVEEGDCGCGVAEGTCSTDPIITASDENPDNGEGKEKAFDGNVNTKWLAFDDSAWIQYKFAAGESKVIKAYSITSADDNPERDPKDWKLLGSNNGTNWTTLDERSNDCFSERFFRKEYRINNNNAYKMYKLDIVSNKNPNSADATQVAEIEWLESSNDGIEPGTEGDCNQDTGTGIRFVAYGDSRSNANQHKSIVGQISAFDPELVLHSGDLWDGYGSSTWKSHITAKSNLNNLLNNNLFLVARGNHESVSEVLKFKPSIVRNGKAVYSFTKGNVFFICLAMDPDDERSFLTNQLKSQPAQDATWKVVFAHYPIYSAGNHGGSGMSAVESIFDQYGVDLYVAGHDHHYERTHQIKDRSVVDEGDDLMAGRGTVYIVSGGGGAPLYSVGNKWWTNTAKLTRHYIEIVTSDTNMALKTVNNSGNTIDSFTISR